MKKTFVAAICLGFSLVFAAPQASAMVVDPWDCILSHYYPYLTFKQAMRSARTAAEKYYLMIGYLYYMSYFSASLSYWLSSPYQPSDLPEWDFNVTAQYGQENVGFQITPFGAKFESDVNSIKLSASAVHDRFMLLGELRREDIEGKGTQQGITGTQTGLLLMPGYRLMTQQENGVDLSLFGILDISELDPDGVGAANERRVSPGAAVSLARMTEVGLFQGSYSFTSSRNTDNHVDLTGTDTINIHSLSGMYSVPLAEKVIGSIGVSHVAAMDIPAGIDDRFTDLRLRLSTGPINNFNGQVGYFRSIDGSDNCGFDLRVGYTW